MGMLGKIVLLGTALGIGMGFVRGLGATGTTRVLDLDATAARLDHERQPAFDPLRVADLSKQFGVPMGRIEMMRDERKGWGAITAELALAKWLARQEPNTYPTPTEALGKIQWLRDGDYKYDDIADKLHANRNAMVRAMIREDRHQEL